MLGPTLSGSDIDSVFALIALIADPAGAKANLDALQEAANAAADDKRAATEERQKATSERAAYEKAIADGLMKSEELAKAAAGDRSEAERAYATSTANRDRAETLLRELYEREAAFQAAFTDQTAALATREDAVAMRELAIDGREEAAAAETLKAARLVAEYTNRISRLVATAKGE